MVVPVSKRLVGQFWQCQKKKRYRGGLFATKHPKALRHERERDIRDVGVRCEVGNEVIGSPSTTRVSTEFRLCLGR